MRYTVKLPNFEGPLDLLLFFIQRDELNIYDIPISKITRDFLEYVRMLHFFDLELAGEFLVMASTLMQIKALMLLPKIQSDNSEIVEEDPRGALVQKLLQYKLFKDASADLAAKADEQRYTYYRQLFEAEQEHLPFNDSLRNATLFDLLRALKKALSRVPKEQQSHLVSRRPVTVEEKVELILELLENSDRINFQDLVKHQEKRHIVATFLAVLDMVKSRQISLLQTEDYDDIVITRPLPESTISKSQENEFAIPQG